MNDVPPEFLARIAEHNRSCWLAAAISLFGAWLTWMFYGAIFTGAILLFEAIRTGDTNILKPPVWFYPAGCALVLGLLVWAGLDRWIKRYQLPKDRSIIGWHLLPDVLFLPARMTFSIWEHLGARVSLSRHERAEAWRLLLTIWQTDHAGPASLAYDFPDTQRLMKLLTALQLLGWIDLHAGDEEWYYRVRSSEIQSLREMLPPSDGEEA